MRTNVIAKNFKEQLCNNLNICHEIYDNIFIFLNINTNEYIIDLLLNKNKNYNNKNNLLFYKETRTPFAFSIPYVIIDYNYNFLIKTLNTFIYLFKRDILIALHYNSQFPFITINNNNKNFIIINNLIKNNKISIDTHIYKQELTNDEYCFFFNIKWKTTKLTYKLLYQNIYKYFINHVFLYNSNNELIDIQYTTKKKIKYNEYATHKSSACSHKTNKKYEILTFLNVFLNNFFIKLKHKYLLIDTKENYYEIFGINKTNVNLILHIKLLNKNNLLLTANAYNNNIISIINTYIKEIFIDHLFYII